MYLTEYKYLSIYHILQSNPGCIHMVVLYYPYNKKCIRHTLNLEPCLSYSGGLNVQQPTNCDVDIIHLNSNRSASVM